MSCFNQDLLLSQVPETLLDHTTYAEIEPSQESIQPSEHFALHVTFPVFESTVTDLDVFNPKNSRSGNGHWELKLHNDQLLVGTCTKQSFHGCSFQECEYIISFADLYMLEGNGVHTENNTIGFEVSPYFVVDALSVSVSVMNHHLNVEIPKEGILTANETANIFNIKTLIVEYDDDEDCLSVTNSVHCGVPILEVSFEGAKSCNCTITEDTEGEAHEGFGYDIKVKYSDYDENLVGCETQTEMEVCSYEPTTTSVTIEFEDDVLLSFPIHIDAFSTLATEDTKQLIPTANMWLGQPFYLYFYQPINVYVAFTAFADDYTFAATLIRFSICHAELGVECSEDPSEKIYLDDSINTAGSEFTIVDQTEWTHHLKIISAPAIKFGKIQATFSYQLEKRRRRRRYLLTAVSDLDVTKESQASTTYQASAQEEQDVESIKSMAVTHTSLLSALIVASFAAIF